MAEYDFLDYEADSKKDDYGYEYDSYGSDYPKRSDSEPPSQQDRSAYDDDYSQAGGRTDTSNAWQRLGTIIMTTPYGGGGWEVTQFSRQTPEQQALLSSLLQMEAPEMLTIASTGLTLADLEIDYPDRQNQDKASAAFLELMDSESFKETMNNVRAEAIATAKDAMAGRTGNFAGRANSSAAARHEKAVSADMALKVDDVIQTALKQAQKTQLQGATAFSKLSAEMSADDLKSLLANRDATLSMLDMETRRRLEEARLQNQLKTIWANFQLGAATTPVMENIAIQDEYKTLHKDLWSGIMGD